MPDRHTLQYKDRRYPARKGQLRNQAPPLGVAGTTRAPKPSPHVAAKSAKGAKAGTAVRMGVSVLP
jgi:hypothetical protein